MRNRSILFVTSVFLLCIALLLSGCDSGSDDNSVSDAVSRFTGSYRGTFTGDDSGTFTMNIDNRGGLTGSGNSNAVGSFSATGLVDDNGNVDFGIATTSAVFNGRISESGTLSGEWINGAASGVFSGSRQ
jgi:hypothetical protein